MRRILLFLSALLMWMGCSNTLEVTVSGDPTMNSGGNAAVVKIYQLSGEANFRNAPLSAFWRDDQGALGNELVAPPRKLTVYPSEMNVITFELTDKGKYLGVAANLRSPNRDQWRSLHSLADMGDQVSVTVRSDRVSVEVEEKSLPDLGIGE